jgi:hypothetical protein
VAAIKDKEGIDSPYALCSWMRKEGKGYFAHGEDSLPNGSLPFDVPAAVREFREAGSPGARIVIPNVHLFQAGRWQGQPYTPRHLAEMVENFRRFSTGPDPLVKVPVVVGHEEEQELLRNTGIPAVGHAEAIRQRGPDLFADLSQIFPDIADLIEAGAYDHVSAEIYPPDQLPEGVPAVGHMLRRVAILGGQLPHLKVLTKMPRPVRLSERDLRPRRARPTRLHACRRVWQTDSRTWACFSEVRVMADDATEQIAATAIKQEFPGLPDGFVESLTPDQLKMLAEAMGGGAPQETPPGEGEPPAAGMVEWPAGLDRQAVEAELVGMGEDQAALAAMTDDDLLALYQEKKGQAATPMSEPDPFADLEDDVTTTVTPPAAARQPKKVTTTKQFSERDVRRLEARVAAAERRQVALDRQGQQRVRAEHAKTVRTYAEILRDENRVSPADVEFDPKTGKPVGPVAVSLTVASPVRKFGEGGKSELDVVFETFRKRPPRVFREQVPDPLRTDALEDVTAAAKAYAAHRNGRKPAAAN